MVTSCNARSPPSRRQEAFGEWRARLSSGHEGKHAPTQMLSCNEVIGGQAVQLGTQPRPELVLWIRVEPPPEVNHCRPW